MEEAKFLKEHREIRGYRRDFVANQLNIAPNTLSQKESGMRKFNMDEVALLCDLYHIKLEDTIEYQILQKNYDVKMVG